MTNAPTGRRQAAALRYVAGQMVAPDVVATGEGFIAEQIIRLAREHGIPVHESPDLVRLLTRLPPESAIPPELYRAVAEVIAFLLKTAHDVGRVPPPVVR
ncbi:MAG: EscU/YscU/HrcU family type III secretion system export apparatus switch protein [Acidobacteria bacterium]|nr:EscU/YscU/HrcU family type III secretion system export apparatus switch protein [Acidobacteriota bacterium]